jgi:hypothetical protein
MTTLARKLQSRNHEVVFISWPDGEPFVRAAGLPFLPCAVKANGMGLDFLRDKATSFTQQRDSSKLKELDVEDLLSRGKPDILVRVFRCLLTDASVDFDGGSALILKVDSEVHVSVLQHARIIGHVLAEDVTELIIAMKQNNHVGGILSVSVQEKAALDSVFTVRPKVAFNRGEDTKRNLKHVGYLFSLVKA